MSGPRRRTTAGSSSYRRCPRCGFTVCLILREVPDEAMLAALRHALARAFVHETEGGGRR